MSTQSENFPPSVANILTRTTAGTRLSLPEKDKGDKQNIEPMLDVFFQYAEGRLSQVSSALSNRPPPTLGSNRMPTTPVDFDWESNSKETITASSEAMRNNFREGVREEVREEVRKGVRKRVRIEGGPTRKHVFLNLATLSGELSEAANPFTVGYWKRKIKIEE